MIPAFPARRWRIVADLLTAVALHTALRWYVASQVEQTSQDDAAQAQRIDAVVDDVAGQVAAAPASRIAQQNEDARQAATDPLRADLDRLRTGKSGTGQASD